MHVSATQVPLNYYLEREFRAPHAIPSSDIDIKVAVGHRVSALLSERIAGGLSRETDWVTSRDDPTWVAAKACYDQTILEFVPYAKVHLDAIATAIRAMLPIISSDLAPFGMTVAPKESVDGVFVYHKTHAASGLYLVPLSGDIPGHVM